MNWTLEDPTLTFSIEYNPADFNPSTKTVPQRAEIVGLYPKVGEILPYAVGLKVIKDGNSLIRHETIELSRNDGGVIQLSVNPEDKYQVEEEDGKLFLQLKEFDGSQQITQVLEYNFLQSWSDLPTPIPAGTSQHYTGIMDNKSRNSAGDNREEGRWIEVDEFLQPRQIFDIPDCEPFCSIYGAMVHSDDPSE